MSHNTGAMQKGKLCEIVPKGPLALMKKFAFRFRSSPLSKLLLRIAQ
jgi:hypothetical protein